MATVPPFYANGIQQQEPVSPFALPTPLVPQRPERRATLRLSPARQEALLEQLQGHYDEAKTAMETSAARRAMRYKRFLSDTSLRDGLQPWEDATKLFMPLTRSTTERLHDEFVETILGTIDNVQIKGIGEEDRQKAERAELFFRWALETQNDIHDVIHDVVLDALIDGLGVLKVYPYRQPFRDEDMGETLLRTIIQIDAIDIGTLGIPPDAKGKRPLQYPECRYLWHQMWIYPEFEWGGLKKRGFKLPGMADLPEGESRSPDERELLEYERVDITPESYQEGALEMIEAYEYFDISGRDDWRFIVANWCPTLISATPKTGTPGLERLVRTMLLKDAIPHTMGRLMWPFFPVTVWRQARQLYGMNVPDRLLTQQDILNALAEQMVHQGRIAVLPYYFYSAALTGDMPDLTQVKPGTGIPVDQLGAGGNGIIFPPRQSDNQHYLQQMNFFRGSAEEDSNVTAFTQGRTSQQPNAPRTLGGLALLLQQGSKTFRKQSHHLARQILAPFTMAFGLWQMRLEGSVDVPMPQTEELQKRLYEGEAPAGVPRVTIDAETLSGLYDVKLKVNPDAAIERQAKLQISETLAPRLGEMWPRGERALYKDIWETLGLQGFDQIWPEYVADLYTMIQSLDLQLKLKQLEEALRPQPPAPPPATPGAPAGPGEEGGLMSLISPFMAGLAQGQTIGTQLLTPTPQVEAPGEGANVEAPTESPATFPPVG